MSSDSLYIKNFPRKMRRFYIPFQNVVQIFVSEKKASSSQGFLGPFSFPLKKKKGKTIQPEHFTVFAFCSTQWQQIQEQNRKSWKVKLNPKCFTHLSEPLWRILRIDSSVIQTASPTALWEVQTQTIFDIFIPNVPCHQDKFLFLFVKWQQRSRRMKNLSLLSFK